MWNGGRIRLLYFKSEGTNHIEGVDMGDIYEIRQQKKLVYKGSFLEKNMGDTDWEACKKNA